MIDPAMLGQAPSADPSALSALLAGGGAPPDDGAPDPLQAIQDAIHAVAAAVSALPGPQDVQDATQAMLVLSRVQTRLMQASGPQAR